MKVEIFERVPHIVEHIELVADKGDRFEMAVLKLLLDGKLCLLCNDCGAYSIFAIPANQKIGKQLGTMKTSRKHLTDYNLEASPWNKKN